MIKSLYKSFIPYLALLLIIITAVFIFDFYAERISKDPELVFLGEEEDVDYSNQFSWQMDTEIALKTEVSIGNDSIYAAAMGLFRQQQYQKAEEKIVLLLNSYPSAADVWNLRGLIAVRLLEHHQAEGYFLRALELDQTFIEARINLASLYTGMHRHKEAEIQYKLAKEANPNNPGIYYNLGLLYSETGQLQASLDEFKSSAELSSGNRKSRALCQMGMVQLLINDTLAARVNLNEAILLHPRNELARLQLALTFSMHAEREEELLKIYRLNPTSFQANYYLGKLYMESGAATKAEYHYNKALEKLPNNQHVMRELGDLLILQNRIDEAKLVLSGFTAGDTLPQAYFYQAKIAAGQGNTGEAIQLYELAVEKSYHSYPEANLNLAILYKNSQQVGRAIESYRNAIAARPDYSLAYYNLAVLYTELDSTSLAIESYLESIRCNPRALKSWYNLGRLYDRQGNSDKAIDAYVHALQIREDYPRALLALANANLRIENYQSAVDNYMDLLHFYPNYTKAWFNLGLAYTRQDEPEKAMDAYEKLIEVDPENVRARINLAILYSHNDRVRLAISVLEDAKDLETDNPDIRFNLALQYKKSDQPREAIHEFLQVIHLDETYRRAYTQLLMLYNRLGDDVNYEIIAFREQVRFGVDVNYYETGRRLHELDQTEFALEAYELALKSGDDRNWLLYWTGKACLDLHRTTEAIAWFGRVLEKDPGHKFSLYRLGQAHEILGEATAADNYYTELLQLDTDFKIVHKQAIQ